VTYDTNDFERDVIERSRTIPVLVDFWAEWCGPCKVLGPVLEKLAGEQSDRWALAKLDTEAFPHISAQYGIRSIPNVKLFVDGEVIDEFVGALPEPSVVEWLRKAIPSRYRMQMADARRMLSDSGAGPALDILRPIIAAEPDNQEALVLTARALLSTDPAQAATIVDPVQLGSPHYDEAEAIRTLSSMFAGMDDPRLLPESPVKERYLQAIRSARTGDYETALEGFIGLVRKDRKYDDDGARRGCIAIFYLLGNDHELTRRYRAALSSALY
jgi:putative thioredoxin